MAAAPPNQEVVIKIIEQSEVSPPPDSVPTTSLPLTFFDFPWLICCQIQRLYFYKFPHPTRHFVETLLPNLKHSLSLTLQHFFPFAANLVCPPPPEKPHILFTPGDSISLTVAESAADFDFLSGSCTRYTRSRPVRALDPFVPKLVPVRVGPLMALQVTFFPNSGICLGVRFNHVAADGRAFHHFMKSWTLLCKTGGDLARLERELGLPSHDRTAIKDPNGLSLTLLNTWRSLASVWNDQDANAGPDDAVADKVRATFVMRRAQIEKLKSWFKNHQFADDENSKPFYISSFVAACALIWVCLAKSEEIEERNPTVENDYEPYYFGFLADCRSRLQFPIPTTYFGNCLTPCYAALKRKELLGENGLVSAAKAITKEVAKLETEALKEFGKCFEKYKEVIEQRHVTVAGSPKFGVYEVDFGWGWPKRSESVHIEDSSTISLAESRDERGGVELGLVQNKDRMSRFIAILEEGLLKFA